MTDPVAVGSREREAQRQQAMLRALWGDDAGAGLGPWLRDSDARARRGLLAYHANAASMAERALAAAYPVLRQLLGDASFAALARAHWRDEPPLRGDLAQWGDGLPAFVAASESLSGEPYLADGARLEWCVHRCELAADAPAAVRGIDRLGAADPARLLLRLRPGTAAVVSPYPIVTIWRAHQEGSTSGDRFAAAREALAAGRGECALVWRRGWRAAVAELPPEQARFTAAVLGGHPLGPALVAMGPAFDFAPWLQLALRDGWLAAVEDEGVSAPPC